MKRRFIIELDLIVDDEPIAWDWRHLLKLKDDEHVEVNIIKSTVIEDEPSLYELEDWLPENS